ncbi:MmcQ/YjbR family DNA-binding protein [Brevibacterium yomogidense]|uniref:MmcQ/YjbR family DNA-binding protein n=1 Tax=Brevibacterium yomogidense TaxID=946573 RepID=UPI0018DFD144
MNGEELHDFARESALELPGASAEWPFGPEYEVFKVRGKVFLMLTHVPENSTGYGVDDELRGQAVITLKADPQDSEALQQEHPQVTPGYHMNKRHWISVATGGAVDEGFVRELIAESYQLVVGTLPVKRRPFGWDSPF